jgi:hypothetical protein
MTHTSTDELTIGTLAALQMKTLHDIDHWIPKQGYAHSFV